MLLSSRSIFSSSTKEINGIFAHYICVIHYVVTFVVFSTEIISGYLRERSVLFLFDWWANCQTFHDCRIDIKCKRFLFRRVKREKFLLELQNVLYLLKSGYVAQAENPMSGTYDECLCLLLTPTYHSRFANLERDILISVLYG